MLNNDIDLDENLFRAIKNFPDWWKKSINRPSSAAFKDSMGVSVDRQGGRSVEECSDQLLERFEDLKSVVYLTQNESLLNGASGFYDRIPENQFHSLLKLVDGSVPLSGAVAKKISRAVQIAFLKQEN